MPIHPTDSITPSEPGGALRLDVRVGGGGVSADTSLGVRSIGQYGAEARMTALNQPDLNYVVQLPGGGGTPPQVIPFTTVDYDYSEFSGLPQADAQSGIFTGQVDGLYEIGCQIAYSFSVVTNTHLFLNAWTDAGYGGAPVVLEEGLAYGAGFQRIGMRGVGIPSAGTNLTTTAPATWRYQTVSTVVCVRNPGGTFYASALPPPVRFLFAVDADNTQQTQVRGNVAGQTYAWMRWLGDPG